MDEHLHGWTKLCGTACTCHLQSVSSTEAGVEDVMHITKQSESRFKHVTCLAVRGCCHPTSLLSSQDRALAQTYQELVAKLQTTACKDPILGMQLVSSSIDGGQSHVWPLTLGRLYGCGAGAVHLPPLHADLSSAFNYQSLLN
jgi:hypothetical protein